MTDGRTRLAVFGCSHSQWAPYLTWADILELNGEMVINYAKAGHGNMQILLQLRKHVELYGKDFLFLIQPTYKARLFDHYTSQIYPERRWFEVGIDSVSGRRMTDLFPGINLVDYLDDYADMMMDAIHHFSTNSNLDRFYYLQVDDLEDQQIGFRSDVPRLTEAMRPRKLSGIYLTNYRNCDDAYRKPQGPIPNHGHCNALQHLENARLIADQLELAPITKETEATVQLLHDHYRSVEFVDVEYVEQVKKQHRNNQ